MPFPELEPYPTSYPGPYERNMGDVIAKLLMLFRDRVPDAESAAKVAELAATPKRWSAGHAIFDEIRQRLNRIDNGDKTRAAQYSFEEACCESVYNASAPDDPFDPSAPFFVAPAAFHLAVALGLPSDAVIAALSSKPDGTRHG